MNFFRKYFILLPAIRFFTKGVTQFHRQQYQAALGSFEKCFKYPEYNNELVFSYYGQSLCALGMLEEGYKYLIKAYDIYESNGWVFDDEHDYNLAKKTFSALKHINEHTNMEVDLPDIENKIKLDIKH